MGMGFFALIFAQDFCAQIFDAQIFAQDFPRIFRGFLARRFLRPFLRGFFFVVLALEKLVFQSHAKIRRKSVEKSAASR